MLSNIKLKKSIETLATIGDVYLVGGAVRDLLLGKQPHDFDFVTNLIPNDIQKILEHHGHKCNLVGKSFGIIVVDGVEIATYRKDMYFEDRIRKCGCDEIEFANTLEEDLSRRDFTINALACDIKNLEIIDFHNGKKDLRNRTVKFIGNPDERIKEDPLRMLRACRFAGKIEGIIALHSFNCICNNAKLIEKVPKERIKDEILKMLALPKADRCIEYLKVTGLLKYVMFPLYRCLDVGQNKYHTLNVYEHCLEAMKAVDYRKIELRLAALLHDVGKPITKVWQDGDYHFYDHENIGADIVNDYLEGFAFPNKIINYVSEVVKKHMFFFEEVAKDSVYRRFISKLEIPVRDMLRMRLADRRGKYAYDNIKYKDRLGFTKEILRRIRGIEKDDKCLKLKDLAVNGKDVMEILNIKSGPKVGEILNKLFDLVIEKPEMNDVDILIKEIEKHKSLFKICKCGRHLNHFEICLQCGVMGCTKQEYFERE